MALPLRLGRSVRKPSGNRDTYLMVRLEEMDVASRNKRLYEYFKSLGLFVAVTSDPNDRSVIDSLTISSGEPKVRLVPFDVCFPLEGSEVIAEVIPAVFNGDNVINFPSKN